MRSSPDRDGGIDFATDPKPVVSDLETVRMDTCFISLFISVSLFGVVKCKSNGFVLGA